MKVKNKGKVHPSPSTPNNNKDTIIVSVLNLLPPTILTLLSVLSLEDREVLAYLITISLQTTNTNTNTIKESAKRQSSTTSTSKSNKNHHKGSPVFDCDCFDCYTCYWTKWDSSPNRELIHQAIEAFEEQHASGFSVDGSLILPPQIQQRSKKIGNGSKSGNKKDKKVGALKVVSPGMAVSAPNVATAECVGGGSSLVSDVVIQAVAAGAEEMPVVEEEEVVVWSPPPTPLSSVGYCSRRGLARKVLPDVLGLLNSRLWSLWSPNL